MKLSFFILVFFLFFYGCMKNEINYSTLRNGETLYKKIISENDSTKKDSLSSLLIKEHPRSVFVFRLAKNEFYDRLYPVWSNDSIKVGIIKELLKKYTPPNQWRRTMYSFLSYSLSSLNNKTELIEILKDFRNEFIDDYLPYTNSARYFYINVKDTLTALNYAQKGYELSTNYPRLVHYPEMEWELEKRSALISAGSYYAEILIDMGKYEQAQEILYDIIDNNVLTVNDETTLCGAYYLMARTYLKQDPEMSRTYLAKAYIEGDSRNIWCLCDTLYKNISECSDADCILKNIRNETGYSDVVFTDVTSEYGLSDIKAGRIAWGDYDNDGFDDILLNGSRLFHNNSGNYFSEVTSVMFPDTIKGNGGLWGDFNNDGKLDIITKEPESVWINRGNFFKRATGKGSLVDNGVSTEGIGIADLNGDGFLDIYFANYEKNYNYKQDMLLFGNGDGTFKDVSSVSGILPSDSMNRAGRGVSISDYDNDGDQDIYVSNYRLTENFLFENDGKGNFTNTADELGIAGTLTEGWWGHTIGSEWSDIDNDGDLDLFTANLAHPRYIDFSDMSMLYENLGPPDWKFSDIRASAGISFEETHSEPAFGDLDNDGFSDLYINDVYKSRRSFLYMSNGNKTFRDVTYLSGTRHFNGWGVAFSDFDNDGDLDILAAGGTIQLFRNDSENTGNWLEVKITAKDHSDGIGTRITLFNDNISLIREIQGGKGTTNQHSLKQHFGLGTESRNFKIMIRFPSGKVIEDRIDDINTIIHFRE